MATALMTLDPSVDDHDDNEAEVDGMAGRIAGYLREYRPLLEYKEQRVHLEHMVVGLLSDLERKSAEPIALQCNLPRRLLQNFLGLSKWSWDPLRKQQRTEVSAEIGIEDGMLIIDPSAVPKKGTETVGVARQWCGRLGKIDNCVVGVHAGYVGRDDQTALVESQLFLPAAWADDPARRAKVHVPAEVTGATKIDIGLDMVKRLAAELPFKWVNADEEYGRSTKFRDGVRGLKKWYTFEVPRNTVVRALKGPGSRAPRRADDLVKLLKKERTPTEILVSYGEKQPIVVDAFMLPVTTFRRAGRRVRETLLYMKDAAGDDHYYLARLPRGASLTTAVRRACQRHRIEEVFAEAKGEVGMDHFECRAWHGWHHHMTLVQMAHWFLVREQQRLGKKMSRNHHQHAPPSRRQDHPTAVDTCANHPMAGLSTHAQ